MLPMKLCNGMCMTKILLAGFKSESNATQANTFLNDYFRLYDQYSFQIIPVMGQLIAGQWKAYQYLVESIRNFPKQEEFKVFLISNCLFLVLIALCCILFFFLNSIMSL